MVEEAGVVTVPGSGFGQVDGTYHFRTTILPSEREIDEVIERLTVFHTRFLQRYAEENSMADGPIRNESVGV